MICDRVNGGICIDRDLFNRAVTQDIRSVDGVGAATAGFKAGTSQHFACASLEIGNVLTAAGVLDCIDATASI
ncbi:hypothetical protein SDC9_79253 [bioreactor metagenome]|uniref:Uncharacterized protein n=1 Tax=bioreactor metagenome TaxID=1076179 RepID=A0A644YXF3_9ZZZZ